VRCSLLLFHLFGFMVLLRSVAMGEIVVLMDRSQKLYDKSQGC
jgi:acyl-CoA synthetase (AMP-forming)/AMP-acid ligase II